MVKLTEEVHSEICKYVRSYPGLAIDCDTDIKKKFPAINPNTLEAILAKEWQNIIKFNYPRISSMAKQFINE